MSKNVYLKYKLERSSFFKSWIRYCNYAGGKVWLNFCG